MVIYPVDIRFVKFIAVGEFSEEFLEKNIGMDKWKFGEFSTRHEIHYPNIF